MGDPLEAALTPGGCSSGSKPGVTESSEVVQHPNW